MFQKPFKPLKIKRLGKEKKRFFEENEPSNSADADSSINDQRRRINRS